MTALLSVLCFILSGKKMADPVHNDTAPCRIVLVEDIAAYREALVMALQTEPDLCVTGACSNAEAFLRELDELKPELVLMDIHLPGMSGIEALIHLKKLQPDVDVMMLTVFEDEDNIFRSLRAGACGYVLKSTPVAEIIQSIREVSSGGAPLTPRIARKVLAAFQPPPPTATEALTEREKEILQLLGTGNSYNAVADALFISLGTVQSHVKNIYRKLHVHSKGEIIAWLAGQRRHPSP
jgi:DNA-binding NarL/FixJ family response regulator